ncbi:hypothetical protein [Belnapia rosea]|uniref:hypothetical protein n=1 Tax=Belnapia rosea TaxID=938405 RepID=UPI0008868B0C|nr:hypothetical protein [Belnapia rosea]SDB70068.1 hypothetical protein SAMN02927895_03648 [Belnapia rosea]
MRRIAMFTAALAGLATVSLVEAQAQTRTTNPNATPNAPGTLPLPGGGVATGPGAPGNASPGVMPSGRGAPPPGMANPPGLGAGTGGSPLTPGGAIRPGSGPGGGGTSNNPQSGGGG